MWKLACLASNTPQEAMLWPALRTSSLYLRSGQQLCSVLGKIQMWIACNIDVSFPRDNFNGWLSHEAFLPGMTCLYSAEDCSYFALQCLVKSYATNSFLRDRHDHELFAKAMWDRLRSACPRAPISAALALLTMTSYHAPFVTGQKNSNTSLKSGNIIE